MSEPTLVLYVEDSPSNFALVRKVLEISGEYRVLEAKTAEDALEQLKTCRPALLLLDLDLPGLSGIDLATQLKQDPISASIPIIAISASVLKHERERALAAGCTTFVEKPFDINVLRMKVREVLGIT